MGAQVETLRALPQTSLTRLAKMADSVPTGLKGKLATLEDFISMQNEELAAQRQEIEALRGDKTSAEDTYKGQLKEMKKAMIGDVESMQREVKRHIEQQKSENQRLQQQITT